MTRFEGAVILEPIHNITNEIMIVGAIYKHPDLLVEYGQYIKPKYDFFDEAARFFYECASTMYQTRTQDINKNSVLTFMAEDEQRLQYYKSVKGWNTIAGYMQLANPSDAKGYFEVLKKYSLLREYQRNGFNIEGIVKHRNFEMLTAQDIYRFIRSKADRINTVILVNEECSVLNLNMVQTVVGCLETPDMGLTIPFKIMNDLFRGFKLGTMMCTGMLSNAGKSRFMFKMIAYIALVKKRSVLVLLNEMSVDEMRFCLLTTVVNNPEFQALHGIKFTKHERDITLGIYQDIKGQTINREKGEEGVFTEAIEDYIARVGRESTEYQKLITVAKWIEDETQGIIYAKDVSAAYDDKTLEFEIRKMCLTKQIQYCFYDTLKSDIADTGDWAAFKNTATKLVELAKQLKIFMYGSIQLTDEANSIAPDELTSSQIANCKQLKHILHTLVLYKEIPHAMFHKYAYLVDDPDWGDPIARELDQNKRYYVGNIDKNRFGEKKKLLFEVDLNTNVWTELGAVIKK